MERTCGHLLSREHRIGDLSGCSFRVHNIWKRDFIAGDMERPLNKTFRTPVTFFVIGLAAADFLTGLAVCPVYALHLIALYSAMKSGDSALLQGTVKATKISHRISLATMNSFCCFLREANSQL